MANRTIALTDRLHDYLVDVSVREPPLLRELREETAKLSMAMMQIGAEQGQLMRLLVELIGARRAVARAGQQHGGHAQHHYLERARLFGVLPARDH